MASVRIPSDPAWPAVFFGGGGFLMIFQDGLAELFAAFAGCRTLYDFLERILEMEKPTLLGLFFLAGLLVASSLSVAYGVWKLLRRHFPQRAREAADADDRNEDR